MCCNLDFLAHNLGKKEDVVTQQWLITIAGITVIENLIFFCNRLVTVQQEYRRLRRNLLVGTMFCFLAGFLGHRTPYVYFAFLFVPWGLYWMSVMWLFRCPNCHLRVSVGAIKYWNWDTGFKGLRYSLPLTCEQCQFPFSTEFSTNFPVPVFPRAEPINCLRCGNSIESTDTTCPICGWTWVLCSGRNWKNGVDELV